MLCWGSGIATPAGDVQQPAELTTASAACCYFCSSLSVALLVQFELQTEFKLLRAGLNPGLLGLGLLLLAQQHEQGVAEGGSNVDNGGVLLHQPHWRAEMNWGGWHPGEDGIPEGC